MFAFASFVFLGSGGRETGRGPFLLCCFLLPLFYCGGSVGGVVLNIIKIYIETAFVSIHKFSHFSLLILPYIPRGGGVNKQLCCFAACWVNHRTMPGLCFLLVPCSLPSLCSATAECSSLSDANHCRGNTGTSSSSCFPTQLQQQVCMGWSHTYQHISALRLQAC